MADRKHSLIEHESRRVGRPSLYHPSMCERIIEMAEDMKFPEQWARELGTSLPSIYRWANTYPELEDAIIQAWGILRAVYAEWLLERAVDPATRPGLVMMIMTRRFPEIYGKDAMGLTEGHFNLRDRTQTNVANLIDGHLANTSPTPEQIANMDESELEVQILAFLERRSARKGSASG